jgi:hypothetical protein
MRRVGAAPWQGLTEVASAALTLITVVVNLVGRSAGAL